MTFSVEHEHEKLVEELAKNPQDILLAISATQMDLVHGAMGVCGEAGELLDAIKKFAVYQKPLDIENVVEELGDIEFYLAMIRRTLSIHRESTLKANIFKLRKRYPAGYTDQAAQDRADKAAVGAVDPEGAPKNLISTYHPPFCGYPYKECNCGAQIKPAPQPLTGVTTTKAFK